MQRIRFMGAAVLALAAAAPAWGGQAEAAALDGVDGARAQPAARGAAAAPVTADGVPPELAESMPASVAAPMPIAPAPAAHVWLGGRLGAPGVAVALERLEQSRGGADTVSNEASLSGLVSGNAAVNVNTGTNVIDGAAFTNAAGIPIVIQNSGANVLIQNATVVNLQLR